LRPGDLILSFDGRPVTKPEDLQPLVLPAARHLLEIVVRRGGRNITVVLPAQVDPVAAAPEARQSGLIVADELGGFPVQAVLAGSAAARLGMRSGDRLLVVDGAQVSSAVQARRILSSDKAEEGRFIVVQRGRKQWGALLN